MRNYAQMEEAIKLLTELEAYRLLKAYFEPYLLFPEDTEIHEAYDAVCDKAYDLHQQWRLNPFFGRMDYLKKHGYAVCRLETEDRLEKIPEYQVLP